MLTVDGIWNVGYCMAACILLSDQGLYNGSLFNLRKFDLNVCSVRNKLHVYLLLFLQDFNFV